MMNSLIMIWNKRCPHQDEIPEGCVLTSGADGCCPYLDCTNTTQKYNNSTCMYVLNFLLYIIVLCLYKFNQCYPNICFRIFICSSLCSGFTYYQQSVLHLCMTNSVFQLNVPGLLPVLTNQSCDWIGFSGFPTRTIQHFIPLAMYNFLCNGWETIYMYIKVKFSV